ncbi:MAG: GspE/PulE family protein [bacterium]|nr:GspE/PulE family protein [bacterium]
MAQGDTKKIDSFLEKSKKEAEERDAQRRADTSKTAYISLALKPIETDALQLIDEARARAAQVASVEKKSDKVVFVAFDTTTPETKKIIEELQKQGFVLKIFTVSLVSLKRAWEFYKYVVRKNIEITDRIDVDESRVKELMGKFKKLDVVKTEIENFDFKKFSTGQLVEIVIAGALQGRASDIHFEPTREAVTLRYRIDGNLKEILTALKPIMYERIVSRIKLLSNLKLNIHDQAQDGRFTIRLGKKEIEMRVALAPSEFGEVIVMRVLDPDSINLSLADLGFRKDDLVIIEKELERPNGMILNTGPTGSGKTTTLYAFLKHKVSTEIKIITVEDPIEYHLKGIEQTQVKKEANYTFANGLRSIMRQDPDVILIGEVRDKETAEIAIQASLTGHLVFSTVHANQAAGAIPRLVDLGVKPTSIGPALNLIIAQRLVRKLCQKCRVSIKNEKSAAIGKVLKNLPKRAGSVTVPANIYGPKGCDACGDSGYRGRIAVYELLRVSKEIEALMNKQAGEIEIHDFAVNQGMVTMQQDGLIKVFDGMTTVEEVEKTTGPLE